MAASRALLFFALAVVLATPACGEDVNFTTRSVDGGTSDSSPVPADATALSDALSGFTHDSGCPVGFDAGEGSCEPNGSFCREARDCCSGRCEQGYCLQSGACSAPGQPCNTRTNCCSERCEPSGRTGGLVCSQYCQANGTPCRDPSD